MKRTAYCKINLTLEILGTKRGDGFHDLKTVMHKIPLGDVVELDVRQGTGKINLFCESDLCEIKDNLAYKAAEMFLEAYGRKNGKSCDVEIKLTKITPVGAGLGGGSADAAAVLDMLQAKLGLIDDDETIEMAKKLGSDVPFCLGRYMSAYCTGRGEECESIHTLPGGTCVVIAKPSDGLNTKGIYGEYDKLFGDNYTKCRTDAMRKALEDGSLADICKNTTNDFEHICIPRLPEIDVIKKTMIKNGAMCSMMSGSGSAVFGLFDSEDASIKCFDALKKSGLAELYRFNDVDFQKMYKGE